MKAFPWPMCRNEHPMVGGNVYVTPAGHRRCRTCKRLSDDRRRPGRTPKKYPDAKPVRPAKYSAWAEETWTAMSERERTLVGFALGYMTLEQAIA